MQADRQEATLKLDNILHKITERYDTVDVIVAGDLNDSSGHLGRHILSRYNLYRIGQGSGSTHTKGRELDQFWTTNRAKHTYKILPESMDSDHQPFLVEIPNLNPVRRKMNVVYDKKLSAKIISDFK
jgi:endonuclease/exonuclease/phosphatase (EEP) superfamily protein YafD